VIRLSTIDPVGLGEHAHALVLDRAHRLAFATGHDLVPGGAGTSDVRWAVTQLAIYARTGEAPEGRRELVGEYLLSLVAVDLVPEDMDPDDVPARDATEEEEGVHAVVLAVLARERLADGQPVPTAWLAALGSTQPSYVRRLAQHGELTRSTRDTGDRRTYVTPSSARRWLETRKAS
jgi:hypothetical protein